MKIESIRFDANVQTPGGPGIYITSAHVNDGFDIERDGLLYYIRNEKLWGSKAIEVPANRTLGAICVVEEPAPRGKK